MNTILGSVASPMLHGHRLTLDVGNAPENPADAQPRELDRPRHPLDPPTMPPTRASRAWPASRCDSICSWWSGLDSPSSASRQSSVSPGSCRLPRLAQPGKDEARVT